MARLNTLSIGANTTLHKVANNHGVMAVRAQDGPERVSFLAFEKAPTFRVAIDRLREKYPDIVTSKTQEGKREFAQFMLNIDGLELVAVVVEEPTPITDLVIGIRVYPSKKTDGIFLDEASHAKPNWTNLTCLNAFLNLRGLMCGNERERDVKLKKPPKPSPPKLETEEPTKTPAPPTVSVPLRFVTLGKMPAPNETAQPSAEEMLTKTEVTMLAGFLSGKSTIPSLREQSNYTTDSLLNAAYHLQKKGFIGRRGIRLTDGGREAAQSNGHERDDRAEARQIAMRYTPLAIGLLGTVKDANGTTSIKGLSTKAGCSYLYAIQMIADFESKGVVTCETRGSSNAKFPSLTKQGNAVLGARLAEPGAGVQDMTDARAAAHRERLLDGVGMRIIAHLVEKNGFSNVIELGKALKVETHKLDTPCLSLARAGFIEQLSYYATDQGRKALLSSYIVFEHRSKTFAIPKKLIVAIPLEGTSKNALIDDVVGSTERTTEYLEWMEKLGIVEWRRNGVSRTSVKWTKEGMTLRTSLTLLRDGSEPASGMVSVKK